MPAYSIHATVKRLKGRRFSSNAEKVCPELDLIITTEIVGAGHS